MILIGFSGPAGCGKDTASDALMRHHVGYDSMGFADLLKQGICEMFCLDHEIFQSRQSKEAVIPGIGKSPRELAKIIGTDCVRRMIGEDTWIKVMERRFEIFLNTGLQKLAITDVRFENEAAWIRAMGGTIIHIVRTGVTWNSAGHESEWGIEFGDDDFILTNTGTVEEFEKKTVQMFADIQELAR